MCPNRHSPDYPMEDSVHRHSNTNIQQPSHSPWPPHPSYHVIRGRSDHHEQKAHHTHQHRANATKVSSRLTDKDSQPPVYQLGLGQRVYILPGALWATLGHLPPIPNIPGHQATRPSGRTTQISQSQPPLTTKDSGDLGSGSSHKDPTPIGDAGCPWEWPPTDATPRDITLEGLPPPSPSTV